MTQIVTYHSANAKPHESWIAFACLPNGEQWLVRCSAHTEAEAAEKARSLYEREIERQKQIVGTSDQPPENKSMAIAPRANINGLTGSVWVLNRETKHKTRIPAAELEGYLSKGYEKAGPRTRI